MFYSKRMGLLALTAFLFTVTGCKKEEECNGSAEKTYTNTGFTRITAAAIMQLHVVQGAQFSIKASGCNRDVSDLRIRETGGGIEFDFKRNLKQRDPVYIDITLPALTAINLSGAAAADVDGFAGQTSTIRTVLSGASQLALIGTGVQTQVALSGASECTISGNTNLLTGNISGGSELRAFGATATEVDITTSGGSVAQVWARQILRADASGGSRVVYRGSPSVKETSVSGGAEIIAD